MAEFLQLNEDTGGFRDLSIGLKHGIMEYWNDGILAKKGIFSILILSLKR